MNAHAAQRSNGEPDSRAGPQFVRSNSRLDLERIMSSIRNFATVSEVLRIVGAAVILASMSLFLLQGWNDGNDIRRYLMLLTQTGLLAAAGFALSHGLREAKGARLFFGLSLVSVPANFAILGALIYSVFQWDGGLTTYPGFATWQIENVASTGITIAGAMVVLVPVTLFCFAIMARHSAKILSAHFLALNVMLLLPVRSSVMAGTIALLATVYALYVAKTVVEKDRALKTAEGRFALAALFIPSAIILFRSMYFYQIDSLMVAILSLAGFLAARQASGLRERGSRVIFVLELLSVPLALTFALAVTDALEPMLARALIAPVFAVAYTALAIDIVRRTASDRLSGTIGVTISLFVSLSFVFSVAANGDALTAVLGLIAGASLLGAGVVLRNRTASTAGVFTALASCTLGYDAMVALLMSCDWIDLAIFGASAIALGSILDRHGAMFKLRFSNWTGATRQRLETTAPDD